MLTLESELYDVQVKDDLLLRHEDASLSRTRSSST
jgi:hypothetical protein